MVLIVRRTDEQFRRALEEEKARLESERKKLAEERQQLQKQKEAAQALRTIDEQARRVSDAIGSLYGVRLALDHHTDKLKLPQVRSIFGDISSLNILIGYQLCAKL